MCLTTIDTEFRQPDPTLRIGYKVLNAASKVGVGDFRAWMYPYANAPIPTDQWLSSGEGLTLSLFTADDDALDFKKYKAGYHILPDKNDAEFYAEYYEPVVRVVYKDVHVVGSHYLGVSYGIDHHMSKAPRKAGTYYGPCHVAQHIFYPSDQSLSDEAMLALAKSKE